MRKAFILFTLLFLITISSNVTKVQAVSDIEISENLDYNYEKNNMYIVGNQTSLSEDSKNSIQEKINEGYFVLIYDFNFVNTNIDNDLDGEDIIATAYYDNGSFDVRKTFSTNEKNHSQIKKDIMDFFKKFMLNEQFKNTENTLLDDQVDDLSISLLSFQQLAVTDTCNFVNTEVESGEKVVKPYGKIVFVSTIYRCDVDAAFDVYMVDTEVEFVPGHALRNLGDTTFGIWDSSESYQKTKISRHIEYYGYYTIVGEDPNALEYWPKNAPLIRTISTSFGIGATLGVSQADGFVGEITANFGYSQSYTTTDPTMSATTLTIGEEYGWFFEFGRWYDFTHHFQSGQMVEMENGNLNGTFKLAHDFWYEVDTWITWPKDFDYYVSRTIEALN
ncbi:hypothetical protein RJI07_01625 [Mycoplasmatota bacterium WC30]